MDSELVNPYDEVPYEDGCYPFTHPDHLATLAAVHGLPVPPVEECRLLELGCARGGNLVPMALELPGATFVGLDLSARQIADARTLARRLGLTNVEFRNADLADVDESLGTFDYVVCHGVYSWVPEPVGRKILEICSRLLSPRGLAYVSYNTFPGWSARGMVRELLRFHTRGEASAEGRVAGARSFLPELVAVLPSPASAYANILRAEGKRLGEANGTYIEHEFFEADNRPCTVREFLGRARTAGLDFLAEAVMPGLLLGLPDAAREAVERWADDVPSREQYLDLVVNRAFRRSVLRRAGPGEPPFPSPVVVERLSVGSGLVPESSDVSAVDDIAVEFTHPSRSGSLTTNNPWLKAALIGLHDERPRPVAFGALVASVRERLAAGGRIDPLPGDAGRVFLRDALLRLYLSGLVQLHVRPPRPAVEAGARPVGSPLARIQASEGPLVTSLLRGSVRLDELARALLPWVDGSRTEAELLDAVAEGVASGSLELSVGSGPVREAAVAREVLGGEIGPALRRLARAGLLAE